MLPENKINEIRNWLTRAERPLFLFDKDADGFCSFQLLKRFIGKGEGMCVKTASGLNVDFAEMAIKYKPDIVFVTDIPIMDQEFVDKLNRTIIWIDHHEPVRINKVHYYNPRSYDKEVYLPVTYLCYKIVKENLWLATIGCISDYLIPDYFEDFKKEFPKLADIKTKDPGDILYKTRLGELIKVINFCLKGKTKEVREFIRNFNSIETPYEILDKKTYAGNAIYERFNHINKYYKNLIEKALDSYDKKDKIILFTYASNDFSFTGELASELIYRNKKTKLVIVGRENKEDIVFSVRSKDIGLSKKVREIIGGLGGYTGGHPQAFGGNLKKVLWDSFVMEIEKIH